MATAQTKIHPVHKKLGLNLRTRRKSKGLSQRELAEILGCSRVNLSNIELGRQGLTVVLLVDVCRELKTTPSALFKGCL